MNLTDFLLSRIAEDEAVAKSASPGDWSANAWGGVENVDVDVTEHGTADVDQHGEEDESRPQSHCDSAHIARWDPARVLAECAAKRAIVELISSPGPQALRLLAQPYADNPGYRDEWRP